MKCWILERVKMVVNEIGLKPTNLVHLSIYHYAEYKYKYRNRIDEKSHMPNSEKLSVESFR